MKALVLAGGGAKGAYQVGALKALSEKGQLNGVTHIYGTSVGALNALYPYKGISHLEKVWREIKGKSDVLSCNWWKLFWIRGQYSTNPLKNVIKEFAVGQVTENINACCVNLKTGEQYYASNQELELDKFREFVRASCAIPLAMDPVMGHWVDGGVREMTPLQKAIEDGHSDIIVVGTNPLRPNPDPWKESWPYILDIGLRAVDILEHEVFLNDLKHCKRIVKVYTPKKLMIDTLEFDPKKIAAVIDYGYEEVMGELNESAK